MTNNQLSDLPEIREHILRMSTDGGCFTGASLSCTDLLVYLYTSFLRISPETISSPERDILLLSKGHDVPALYGVFAELGFIERDRLKNHLRVHDHIYWHPNRNISGVEFHSGSLGHLLSVGLGMAVDIRMRGLDSRVVVILGDGELNEGSVWEACLTAHALKVDNLIAVVDRNLFQANVRTEDLIPLEPLTSKFEAFGWNVECVNGHDFEDLDELFRRLPERNGAPTVVIADTQRGRGVPSISERADRWFCNFTHEEVDALIDELHGRSQATITSKTLVVR
ncbi:MAG: transketolase [Candidatus Kapabacteria bacterium]|nr:transketolase [Candidatus Kapabacteria bacterium]